MQHVYSAPVPSEPRRPSPSRTTPRTVPIRTLPAIMLDADTLNVRRVFCTDPTCRRWVDLVADAEEVDRTHSPWEET
jgi:hypothetical protein